MIIRCKHIYGEDRTVDGYLVTNGRKIQTILRADQKPEKIDEDWSDMRIIPGIFDTHNHGTMGYAMMGECPEPEKEIRGYVKGLASQGVTSVLATADEHMFEALAKLSRKDLDGARIVGIHSEGPYLNRVGEKAIDTGHPDVSIPHIQEMIDKADGTLKLMGIAPELPGALEAVDYLTAHGIRVAFTHSNADYDEAIAAFQRGITVTTHTANVMSGIHHRRMGGLGASLLDREVNNEIICDLLHVSKEMLEIMFRCKPYDKFLMISDNVPMSGAPVGRYSMPMSAQESIVCNIDEKGYCLTDTGRLCGSAKPVLFGIGNLVEKMNIPMETVIRMSSLNQSRLYGVGDEKGSLRAGKDADFTVISDHYEALETYSEGRKVYDRRTEGSVFNQEFIKEYKVR